jgi:natural product biosynthesis luciferase-like monooxygenase protein
MKISLLFFANRDAADAAGQYRLLLDSAKFADSHGLTAIWIPERHFHPFGGAYPNPALAAAAIATVTSRIRVRAGSVVLPLNDVLRVAEDWQFVDNLSGGRVDLAFASGWNANDFVLAPDNWQSRKTLLPTMINDFRTLWHGQPIKRTNGRGEETCTRVFPAPVQPEPGLWLTASSSARTFVAAGSGGFNVLTALLFMSVDEIRAKIGAYRRARAAAGLSGQGGQVTLMLHTYLGASDENVLTTVRPAFLKYLESSADLWGQEMPRTQAAAAANKDALLSYAFERYARSAALFGTVESCLPFVRELADAGVDEIACLVDFGIADSDTMQGLIYLAELTTQVRSWGRSSPAQEGTST